MKITTVFFVLATALSILAAPQTASEPAAQPANGIQKRIVPCPVCAHSKEGRGKLRLSPPDHGQNKGSMLAKSYYDVKCVCPICHGKTRRQTYRFETPPMENLPPCRTCGWSGVEKCRKCHTSGIVPCSGRECRNGWLVRRNEMGSGKGSRHVKMVVEPCPVCGGVGKIICTECQGLGGTPCRACSGLGKKVR